MNPLQNIIKVEAITEDRLSRYFASMVLGIVAGAFFMSITYFVITAVSALIDHVAP